ncbi:MAG: hypothetical protein SFY80_03600 [Verrucomicrobiota bacterium]|nr:hypothetical protein [Verrucomicrobiota bacterium]
MISDVILLMRKKLDLAQCPTVYNRPMDSVCLQEDWVIRGGEWKAEDGWFTGRNPENKPAMITARQSFPYDVMLDFEARTVLPSSHDIDWMWNGSWDESQNLRSVAYVAGLQGWWEGKVGFEKAPDYLLNVGTPLFPFEPGRTYRIQSGSVAGHVFVLVDGKLILEVTDPQPIDSTTHGMIGFEAYASWIQIRNLSVRKLSWEARDLSYPREF